MTRRALQLLGGCIRATHGQESQSIVRAQRLGSSGENVFEEMAGFDVATEAIEVYGLESFRGKCARILLPQQVLELGHHMRLGAGRLRRTGPSAPVDAPPRSWP